MRVINLALETTSEMTVFYKSLDCEAFIINLIREGLELLSEKNGKEVAEDMIKSTLKSFRYYRNDLGQAYGDKEFALAEKLKFLPLYLSSSIGKTCFTENIKQDIIERVIASFFELSQAPLSNLTFILYPKIFDITSFHEDYIENATSVGTVSELNGRTIIPASIPANMNLIVSSGVYLIDNGIMLYLSVRSNANQQILQDLFEVSEYSQI